MCPQEGTGKKRLGITPDDRVKALSAFELLSAELGHGAPDCTIEIDSNIPVAKGYASSTADILATAQLCIRSLHPQTPEPVVRALALSVARKLEYGDYLLHPGVAACAQRTHRLLHAYRTDLRWTIVGIDEGGWVRTEEFHQERPDDPGKARVYAQLFAQLDTALRADDYAAAAEVASRSAELHNDRLPKKSLEDLRRIQQDLGALGVCVAHSGTLAGLIFSRHQPDHDLRVRECRAQLSACGYSSETFTLKEAQR
ncbi:hypothetical protein GCM10012285_14600 [Streptomyces kronopolitis]|uniref:GHMP kinase N-terminal domain-containing protein n=1 Tax=Streptomyces kronopolitis TaxID=1612435 RepID=A0ABQ2J6W0_9ACTN|nr:hypothetical protein GCM10012285_14600 [Streptomyces kronopolitis]